MGIRNSEVSWKVLGVEVFGTVTSPDDDKQHPAVVFVAGSGPTDRDWCSPLLPGTSGSARLLAEALAGHGYVTLRYDKMASGPHARENLPLVSGKMSMESHLQELSGAVSTVASLGNVDSSRLFLLTNSEGAIHAANYAESPSAISLRGLVLTAPPGRSVGAVARAQIEEQLKGIPDAGAIMEHYDSAVSRFQQEEPIEYDELIPEGIRMVLKALETPANLPFSRELWSYDLSVHLGNISAPILVLIGRKDVQVDWKTDGSLLEESLSGNREATFAYPENANHVLKKEDLPREQLKAEAAALHYNDAGRPLDEESLNTILGWLGSHS